MVQDYTILFSMSFRASKALGSLNFPPFLRWQLIFNISKNVILSILKLCYMTPVD